MTTDGKESLAVLLSSVSQFLSIRNLQLSRAGFKGGWGKHEVDTSTGSWANPSYSRSKPPRWLLQVLVDGENLTAVLPDGASEENIAVSNTAQGYVAALVCKIQPAIGNETLGFEFPQEAEVNAIFVFKGALPKGSSADAFAYEATSGRLTRVLEGKPQANYIFAALLGTTPGVTPVADVGGASITYTDVLESLQRLLQVDTGAGVEPIPIFDLTAPSAVRDVLDRVEDAWQVTNADTASDLINQPETNDELPEVPLSELRIPVNPTLLGVDISVYHQVNAALNAGKRHIMFYGPPGTGKTTLAQWVAENLPGARWTLLTGSADWTSQDIVGGYQPVGDGDIAFVPGVLLRNFDRPLIIDELNRCDIDKVLGPLFTVLSGQSTTLPYRTDIRDTASEQYVILPVARANTATHEFSPGSQWRLIATINSLDRASLYQMSYALSRRFAWIYVGVPKDTTAFVADYLHDRSEQSRLRCPVAAVWDAVNKVRAIGPAPIIDILNYMQAIAPDVEFFGAATDAERNAFLSALDMSLLPMLDGISYQEAASVAQEIVAAFDYSEADADAISNRLATAAV